MRHFRTRGMVEALCVLVAMSLLVGCGSGSTGAPGSSTGVVTGQVTNAATGSPIPGALIQEDPDIPGVDLITDASGVYVGTLPVGMYMLDCEEGSFEHMQVPVSIVADGTATADFPLDPTSPVIVTITGVPASANPGDVFTLTAVVEVMDGSTVLGFSWDGHGPYTMTSETTASPTVTLDPAASFKDAVLDELTSPRRWGVLGISPFALEEAGLTAYEVEVETTSGFYDADAEVHVHLDFARVASGLFNVPAGVPVLLNSKEQASYDWIFLSKPGPSTAAFDDPTSAHPSFVPDVPGAYTVSTTDLTASSVSNSSTFTVYASTWLGAITGIDPVDGLPLADGCTFAGCHAPGSPIDKFTAWRQSGHAHIFTVNINGSGYYNEGCFACHTVGYDPTVDNGGIDDADDYADFLAAGLLGNPSPDNWETVVNDFHETGRHANIQCENCHGPQSGGAHMNNTYRVDISSDVCGTCHGEPTRHARYQQWELSDHSDYGLASSRGTSSHCGRCHAGQGNLLWLPQLLAGNPGNIEAPITYTSDEAHPQVCVVCHDPHDPGTESGEPNDVKLRVQGDTPLLPAGYAALAVGNGAQCMVCHNTRNGAHNDVIQPLGDVMIDDRAPHTSAQGDVLMGQNAYFVEVGVRSPHSLIENTCTKCHMDLSDPPAELSHDLGGTNHTFAASLDICAECHGEFDGEGLQEAIDEELHGLEADLEEALTLQIQWHLAAGGSILFAGDEPDLLAEPGDTIDSLIVIETHGRSGLEIVVDGVLQHGTLAEDTTVFDPSGFPIGNLLTAFGNAGQVLARASWNYWLLHGDHSHGVHHPSFYLDVINATRYQLWLYYLSTTE